MKRRYPLDALVRVRQHETLERAREKAASTEARRQAERRVLEASERKTSEKARLRTTLDSETARLGEGRARASDLLQGDRYRKAAARRVRAREEEAQKAVDAGLAAARKERAATSALAAARGAEKALSGHRSRFRAAESRSADRREEDTLADVWRSVRGPRRKTGE